MWTVNSTRSQNKISKICRSDSVAPTIGWSVNVQHKTLGEENRQPLVNCMALMRIYPLVILVMTNSSPWYRWRLAIDGLPIKHGDFLWLLNHQMVSSNSGKETSNNGELMRNNLLCMSSNHVKYQCITEDDFKIHGDRITHISPIFLDFSVWCCQVPMGTHATISLNPPSENRIHG